MATVPKQLATPEDTFTALALQFNFEQRIKDKIIELGIRTIAEFRHYARSEDEIKKLFIDTIKDPAYEEMQGRLQAARLRFAWTACKALLPGAWSCIPVGSPRDWEPTSNITPKLIIMISFLLQQISVLKNKPIAKACVANQCHQRLPPTPATQPSNQIQLFPASPRSSHFTAGSARDCTHHHA